MNVTLEFLSSNPHIVISSSIGTSIIHWLDFVNPIISFLGMLVGLAVGVITLILKIKELIK